MKGYALHTNDEETLIPVERRQESAGQTGIVVAVIVGFAALVLGAIAFSDTQTVSKRVDNAMSTQQLSSNKHAVRSMLSSSIAAHPVCGSNLQACVDLMNVTSHMATENFTIGNILDGSFSHFKAEGALLAHDGTVLAKGPQLSAAFSKFTMPTSANDCAMTFGNTCLLQNDAGHLMTLTAVKIHMPDAQARRDFATALDTGFQYGKDGAGFGAAVGGAAGTLIEPGGGSAIGGAIGGLVGGVGGFAAGMYEGW
jgi:hypothetical protein